MIKLVLIRHPETEGNIVSNSEMTKIIRPNHLLEVTGNGMLQVQSAITAYQHLKLSRPDRIYHSTATRTKILATHLANNLNTLTKEDSRLNEMWSGIFHSLAEEVIQTQYPEQIELRKKFGWYHYVPLSGENGPMVQIRIWSFLRDLADEYSNIVDTTILLCTHGNWQFLFEGIALKQSWQQIEEQRQNAPIPNCSISVFNFWPPSTFALKTSRFTLTKATNTPEQYA